jgi:lipopolysaccharide/colanic/teichoic acid biosynthesis glycosyltransferase
MRSDLGHGQSTADNMVTPVGRILRPFHLDEIPQFWNVLKGEMSLVGPRPEIQSLVEHYENIIPFYQARHLIKPGLTGWARIRHKREPHHSLDIEETQNKLAYDLYYLVHRSVLFDLYILVQTIRYILTARGS